MSRTSVKNTDNRTYRSDLYTMSNRPPAHCFVVVIVKLVFISAVAMIMGVSPVGGAYAKPITTGVELLSGFGYGNSTESIQMLIGAEVVAHAREGTFFTGIQESHLGLHLSDTISLDGSDHALTVGVEGSVRRSKGPFQYLLEGNMYFKRFEDEWTKSSGFGGIGVTGRVMGSFRFDYVESAKSGFPWFQKDLHGIAPDHGDEPFYRAHIGVSAMISSSNRLSWSQDVRWRQPIGAKSNLTVTTGPEFVVGQGRIAVQGGMLIRSDGIEPIALVRYDHRPIDSNVEFQITAATNSLEGQGPLVYGWLGVDGYDAGYAIGVRLQRTDADKLDPTVYFSIKPKF